MRQLRKPNGEKRGLRKVKCVTGFHYPSNQPCDTYPLYHLRVSVDDHGEVTEATYIVCSHHLESVEKTVETLDHVDMEWRELRDDEYETIA